MVNLPWDDFCDKLTSSKWAKTNKFSSNAALHDLHYLVAQGILIRTKSDVRIAGYDTAK